MTSIRTYITIAFQDLCDWLRVKLSHWLLGDVNARLHKLEVAPAYGLESLDRNASLEKQLSANLASIAIAFARDNERITSLEHNAEMDKATLSGIAVELAGIRAKIAPPTKPTPKTAAKPARAKTGKAQ